MKKNAVYILVLIFITGCFEKDKLPVEKYFQFNYTAKYTHKKDTLTIEVKNPLCCPLRVSISSPDKSLGEIVNKFGTLTLQEKTDTVIKYPLQTTHEIAIEFHSVLGDLTKEIIKTKVRLPFPANRSYKIIQGYNGNYSHNNANSRYAIDFALKTNDTICSADNGYVVGVIKDYQKWGTTEDWLDYCNFITIYHAHSGLFTQYVHLVQNGSFVKVGDTVLKGQPIGLSGRTGYTTVPHLHFSAKQPDKKDGFISTEIDFEEGYEGKKLTKNTIVRN